MSALITSENSSVAKPGTADERVSVVIPCYNEERFIIKALEQLADQYEQGSYEIIVVDGCSDDQTRRLVEQFQTQRPHLRIRLVDNPARNIPTALNLGVQAATGSIIARMDAHAAPSAGYIRRCVEVLKDQAVGVVGMPCRVRPSNDTLMAQAIAQAVSHPFGIGDAKYRLVQGVSLQESVDTVAFACFRKDLWIELEGFNEELLTNEDYDFNYRVRLAGQEVLLDRSGHCDYFARGTLKTLAQQYVRYGWWKAQMLRLRPRSIKLRHFVAPAFVLSLLLLALAGIFVRYAWWLLLAELAIYLVSSLLAGLQVARRAGLISLALVMPVVFATIHLSWGASFLLGLMGRKSGNPPAKTSPVAQSAGK